MISRSQRVGRSRPTRLDVAGWFAKDAADYLARFRCCFYSEKYDFQSVKSRRLKTFVDLRGAVEALMKAFIALRQPYLLGGKPLVAKVEGYGHRLDVLFVEVQKLWRLQDAPRVSKLIDDCTRLPIGLRYTLDAMDLLQAHEDLYYSTVGSEAWMSDLELAISTGRDRLQRILDRRSRIVSGSDIKLEDLLNEPFSKFRKKSG